jgi:hypothetical protein
MRSDTMSKQLNLMATILIAGALTVSQTAIAAAPPSAAIASPQSRDGQNRRVRIHNQTGWTLVKFQAADARTRAWQADVLGSQNVATGASTVVTVDDGSGACVYVFRAEFSNGQTLERASINVCEIADYYLTR